MKQKYEFRKKHIYFFLFALPFILYWNSYNNEYAIDDNIVVENVAKVEKGISGIPEIFTTHYANDNNQSYGYRPIVQSTFAIEKEFFSGLPSTQSVLEKKYNDKLTQANISHIINVFLYACTGILMFFFLSLLLPAKNLLLPALITTIFILLPVHTEPVNNVKSRDELLVFLGILGALLNYLKYSKTKKLGYVLLGIVCFIFALLSKKSAIALIGLVPVMLHFANAPRKKIVISTLSLLFVVVCIFIMKKNLLQTTAHREIQYFENPLFFEGSFWDRLATGFYCAFFYLKMLIYPYEFSFYYGYSQIPLINWSFYQVWIGMLVFIPLSIYGIIKWWKRDILGLGIAIWIGTMLGVINIFYPAVGVVADRFTYIFSFGFCIVISVLLVRVFRVEFIKERKNKFYMPKGILAILIVIGFLYTSKIIARNNDWENYLVLYRNDVKHLPNSAKANVLLGNQIMLELQKTTNEFQKRKLIKEAMTVYENAIEIYPNYSAALNNLASLYITYFDNYEKALPLLLRAENEKENITIYNIAIAYNKLGEYKKSLPYLIQALRDRPEKTIIYEELFKISKDPSLEQIINLELAQLSENELSNNYNFHLEIGKYYYRIEEFQKALKYYEKASALQPKNQKLILFIDQLQNFILNKNQ